VSDDLSIPSPTYRIPRHRQGMDPATRRLAMIAGGLGGVLLAVVGGWTLIGHRSAAVPVVQADSRPIRVKPENPGGMQVAGADADILSGSTESKNGRLAPAPEAPAPQALTAPPAPPPVVGAAVPTPVPTVVPAAAKPVAAKPAPIQPAPAQEKRPTASAANGAMVQLTAVHSEDAAKSEWQRLARRLPDLLGQRKPAFSKTEHDGKAMWRVRTGGFADVAQATAFCEKVRAKGAGCSVADF
jgi:hypothetical protein